MANYSDHKQSYNNINSYLPEVYRSSVNSSAFEMAFNRHLTKDDTARVAGFIGDGNPLALIDRQIAEPTAHRQAFQLAPTMFSTVGTVENALSFKAFQGQLDLMGVDIARMDKWGNAQQFNWVPPINMDLLINYQDYFWKPDSPTDAAQYITIENQCNKALSKVQSYNNVLLTRGNSFAVQQISYANDQFVIANKLDDLFVDGFVFFTNGTSNPNLQDSEWTVASSTYDLASNQTTINLIESVANAGPTPPTTPYVGQWWYDTNVSTLKEWNGSAFVLAVQSQTFNVDLLRQLQLYQYDANCTCNQSYGWDTGEWDGVPDGTDSLNSRIPGLGFNEQWDFADECIAQEANPWSSQNRWIHKSQVRSFADVKRAQLPILEYNSSMEMNEWTEVIQSWKYRGNVDAAFDAIDARPTRFELEPIKGFTVANVGGRWKVFMFDREQAVNVNVNYTDTFTPSFRFRITDDTNASQVYTVDTAEYREITSADPVFVTDNTGVGTLCTVVTLQETIYTSPTVGGTLSRIRLEPIVTSQGDAWRGYHVHWVLIPAATRLVPTAHQPLGYFLNQGLMNPPVELPMNLNVTLSGDLLIAAGVPQSLTVGSKVSLGTSGSLPTFTDNVDTGRQVLPTDVFVITNIVSTQSFRVRLYEAVPLVPRTSATFAPGVGQLAVILPSHADDATPFQPVVGSITVSNEHQELQITATNITRIDLVDKFRCIDGQSNIFATPNSNELRVYVNGVRQYASYTEVIGVADDSTFAQSIFYTVVGLTPQTSQKIEYVKAIIFNEPLTLFDAVRIEVGPASQRDAGLYAVPVRTVEDELEFTLGTATGMQPQYISMGRYQRVEQAKVQVNQYPQFNIYDVVTSSVVKAAPTFGYRENPDATINRSIGLRITADTTNRLFEFEQTLLDRDSNLLYGYRNKAVISQYWYSPVQNQVRKWDGYAWTTEFVVELPNGVAFRAPVISDFQPELGEIEIGGFWMNTLTNTLFQATQITPTLVFQQVAGLVVSDTDPSLQTVWQPGTNAEQYVPSYVNAEKQPVAIGSADGDWEVAHQWRYNAQHENRQYINYSQLITHFSSILNAQTKIPGLQGGGIYTRTQNEINYGVGGTIKEYNESYDTLVSAVNITSATPVGIIEFANQQYSTGLLFIRDVFNKSIEELLTSYSQQAVAQLPSYISNIVIDRYESNDFTAQTYNDTTAYNAVTGKGVRNWVATIPMMGLGPVYRPHLSVADGVVRLFHHDGHRTEIQYTGAELDKYARIICNHVDPRFGGTSKFGKITSAPVPTTAAALEAQMGTLRPVMYWYQVGSGQRTLYRFAPINVGAVDPSIFYDDGTQLPDGVRYYNTTALATYEKTGNAWVPITTIGAGDITPLWEVISLPELLGNIQLNVETSLFEVTPDHNTVFDFGTLAPTLSEEREYVRQLRHRFTTFLTAYGITAPFANVDYSAGKAFTWNYAGSTVLTPPRTDITPDVVSSWQGLYTRWYGTPYPHLEPWTLQGFLSKPTWWEDEYASATTSRRWTQQMWTNIAAGVVPIGRTYPDGSTSTLTNVIALPTFNYFSVNISNTTLPGGYPPDSLLPPYYDVGSVPVTSPATRSLFVNITSEIGAPDADYAFGDLGPVEWAWTVSPQYAYDLSIVAFLMQPMRFMHAAFGPRYTIVNDLQVETTFNQVYSHADALFHGDIYRTNQTYEARGLNQWYVNFNRYTGIDTNGEFRQLWAGWVPRMTYQFAGIVDTSTFEIANKYFDVINQDYEIILVNNGIIKDLWVDSFEASLISIPPALVQYNNQAAWRIELDTLSSTPRDIQYYGTKAYQFTVNPVTDVATAFMYSVLAVNTTAGRFTVPGDQTGIFQSGSTFTVTGSTSNDGTYTVITSTLDTSTNRTRITVAETIPQPFADGMIAINKQLPWQTGDAVVVSSAKFLPAPLASETLYYIIRLSPQTFKLAETQDDAILGNAINLTSAGDGALTVAQVESSFRVLGGQGNSAELWYHYALDTDDVRTFQAPYTVVGMQSFIDLIDGYAAYSRAAGQLQNIADSSDFDPDTGRLAGWDVEVERFINWAYGLRQARITVSDRYPVTASAGNDTLTFGASVPVWLGGTAVSLTSSGELPMPLIDGSVYYVINTGTPGVIRLSTSANTTDTASYIDLTTPGTGQTTIGLFNRNRAFPRFELNASRNNMWIDTPLGVLSNAVSGPYADVRVNQTLFDQYSRPVGSDKVTVFRQDERSHIQIRSELPNDVDAIYSDDPYNYIHLGGAHLFVESYEHFLVFNNYTVGGALMYDPFFGLQAQKFSVDYFEKEQYTLRPTLGGYYLLDQKFNRNIEGSASDLQNYYDAQELSESTEVARRSRALLGYKGRTAFLDFLNINSKSQFLFYRGLIQTKGSVNSIKAYINSRRFVDASLDDFWAWKIADFGDSRRRVYPEIKLFSTDSALDDVRLEFLAASERETDEDIAEAIEKGFQPVSFRDDKRWNLFPEQKGIIKSPLFLDTEASSLITIFAGITPPPPGSELTVSFWFDTINRNLFSYGESGWTVDRNDRIVIDSIVDPGLGAGDVEMLYFSIENPIDEARVIRKSLNRTTTTIVSIDAGRIELTGDQTGGFGTGQQFALVGSPTSDGPYVVVESEYSTLSGTTFLTVDPLGTQALDVDADAGLIIIQDFTSYTLEVYNAGSGIREFTRIDSQVLRFQLEGVEDLIQIFTLVPARSKLSPARLIDTKSQTVVQNVPLWDPARGTHSHVAIHNVDLVRPGDPATYEFTPNPNDANEYYWNDAEVGTVWLDTAELGYVPYYDDKIFTDVNDRLYNWGKLAPWSSVKVYEWVASPVPPEQWDSRVVEQGSDPLIPQNSKATGTPLRQVFKRVRTTVPVEAVLTSAGLFPNTIQLPVAATPEAVEFENEDQIMFTAAELPGGIVAGTAYNVANKTVVDVDTYSIQLIDPATEAIVTIATAGTSVVAVPKFKATDWNTQSLIRDRLFAPYAARDKRVIESAVGSIDWETYTITDKLYWTPTTPAAWVLTGVGADLVDVYVNGSVVNSNLPVVSEPGGYFSVTVIDPLILGEADIIDIVRPVHSVTQSEAEFDPDSEDDGTQMIQWKEDFQYSATTRSLGNTNAGVAPVTTYYFWVQNSTSRDQTDPTSLSALEIARQIETIPSPYFVLQRPKDDPYLLETYGYGSIEYGSIFSTGILSEAEYQIPVLYREAIIRKVASYINDDDRYIIRFTRDFTLRDDLEANGAQFNLKDTHQEWFLFRRDQNSTIPRELWNRLTEALSGRKMVTTKTLTQDGQPLTFAVVGQTINLGQSNVTGLSLSEIGGFGLVEGEDYSFNRTTNTVTLTSAARLVNPAPYQLLAQYTFTVSAGEGLRVPSLERELYDSLYGTDTQYGLGEDQAFVNRALGLNTVISFLSDPNRDFSPIDIDTFFATNLFDTPENIERTMDVIYTTFSARNVNAIWFETLLDALSTRAKYKELLKTSWIALHGIRVLEVGGLFDD